MKSKVLHPVESPLALADQHDGSSRDVTLKALQSQVCRDSRQIAPGRAGGGPPQAEFHRAGPKS